jgi:hypothetical protein
MTSPLECIGESKAKEVRVLIEQHKNAVTYRGFHSQWKFISVPKTQHTTVKCDQPFSKHKSGIYTQRCPTQDSFYRTSSGNFPTGTRILAVSLQTQVRAQPLRSSGTNSHSCSQEASKHTCFSRNIPILTQSSIQQESVAKCASALGDFQTRTDYKSIEFCRQKSRDHRNVSVSIVAYVTMLRICPLFEFLHC